MTYLEQKRKRCGGQFHCYIHSSSLVDRRAISGICQRWRSAKHYSEDGTINSQFIIIQHAQWVLFYKTIIFISSKCPFKEAILHYVFNSSIARHSGYEKILTRAKRNFFWMGMKAGISTYVKYCDTCQWKKIENTKPSGLLQLLPVPEGNWSSIFMDFIERLLTSHRYSVLLIIVDRLTKYAHFILVTHLYSAATIAKLFT